MERREFLRKSLVGDARYGMPKLQVLNVPAICVLCMVV